MKPIDGYYVIPPDELHWRPSHLMRVPHADLLKRTRSELLGARYWRLPPKSADSLHKHHRAEELYVVLQGTGRIRVDGRTITVPQYGGVLVGPQLLRQIFNDGDEEVLWLVIGSPEAELTGGEAFDSKLLYPMNPRQLPAELNGAAWPPAG